MLGSEYGWYVLATDASRRMEFKVKHALNQSERPAMVPFEEKMEKRRGKRYPIKTSVPLYPSYVFVQLETHKIRDEFYNLKSIDGVRGLLSQRRGEFLPLRLSEEHVELIQSLSENGWRASMRVLSPFQPGSNVKIIDGPFLGFPAKIDSVVRKRISVMLQIFGSMRVVEVGAEQLAVA